LGNIKTEELTKHQAMAIVARLKSGRKMFLLKWKSFGVVVARLFAGRLKVHLFYKKP
jgi:hypothetical protein